MTVRSCCRPRNVLLAVAGTMFSIAVLEVLEFHVFLKRSRSRKTFRKTLVLYVFSNWLPQTLPEDFITDSL